MLIGLLLALALDDPADTASAAAEAPTAQVQTQAPVSGGSLQVPSGDNTQAPAPALRFVWRDHPSVRAGRNFRLDFAVKVQEDARDPGDDPSDFPTWELHRFRVGVEGEIFRRLQFSVERELSEKEINDPAKKASKTPWKDVYLEANLTTAAQVRVGKFKVPYGLDQTSGESNLDLVYRSLGGSYLSPGRDIGVMVHGRFFDRGLNYWIGGFQQDGENSRSSKIAGADTTIAARVTAVPFRRMGIKGLELGASFASSELSDEAFLPNGLRGRTVMSQYTFFDPVFVKGTRRRYGADLDLTQGSLGARAEYMLVTDTRTDQGLGNQDLSDARGHAWYALGTWVLTGEKKTRPVEARRGGLGRHGVGAIELAARFDRLWFDSEIGSDTPFRNSRAETILPSGDKVFTAGLTYYANRFVKIQLNGIREHLEDPERSPVSGGLPFWSTVLRFQFEL